jgi:hypothetical protein
VRLTVKTFKKYFESCNIGHVLFFVASERSASLSGGKGRWFKSSRSDQKKCAEHFFRMREIKISIARSVFISPYLSALE